MKVAVTGPNGRLGQELLKFESRGFVGSYADITKPKDLQEELDYLQPDIIINCAAYTDVDGAETKDGYKEAIEVNTRGVSNVLEASVCPVIHISTDYVFNCLRGPYREGRIVKFPVNNYGYSKWGGEIMCRLHRRADREVTVVRTTGLFGGVADKPDFVSNLLTHLEAKSKFKATAQLYGNQTYTPFLAFGLLQLVGMSNWSPIIHIASKDVVSRAVFARKISKRFSEPYSRLVVPSQNNEIPGWVANRPQHGGLEVDLAKQIGIRLWTIDEGLDAYFAEKS